MTSHQAVALLCHPATSPRGVASVEVRISRTAGGSLALAYQLRGDLARLDIPAPQPCTRADGLWEHTCFEAFIACAGNREYRELNFSPSGQWAAYAFCDYRKRDESARFAIAPQISVRRFADRLELDALVGLALLPRAASGAALELGLATVVEPADGERSSWALAHPAARPDFHDRAAFLVKLAPREEGSAR